MREWIVEVVIMTCTMAAFASLCFVMATNINQPLGYYGMVALALVTLSRRLDHVLNLIRLPIALGIHGVTNRIG